MNRWIWCLPLIVLAGLFIGSSATAGDERVLFTQAATGTRTLRPFVVQSHWEIRWTCKDGIAVAVMLADPDPKNMMGKLPVASGAQMVPGSGSTYVEAGGHYYLKVDSYGDWTITVVQLP